MTPMHGAYAADAAAAGRSQAEIAVRCDLAAAYRLIALHGSTTASTRTSPRACPMPRTSS